MERSPGNLKFIEVEPLGKPEHSSFPIPMKHCELNLFCTGLIYANAIIPCINLVSEIFCLRFANVLDK